MNLNETPSANRIHIAFFGRRNVGKSSLVNAVTGQNTALVSQIKGTTTDPVYKAMELLPLGPVVIIDTPGFDDEGELGNLRIQKTRQVLNKTDAAILVLDNEAEENSILAIEQELISLFKSKKIPYIIVLNKYDLHNGKNNIDSDIMPVSAKTGHNINQLKEKIAAIARTEGPPRQLIGNLIGRGEIAILVIPIDKAAPKGRLILPQQQTLRSILDMGGITVTAKETELKETLSILKQQPALVITDSQVFAQVSAIVPDEIALTSFSILFAHFNGWLETAVSGAKAINTLAQKDNILICEGCTHHRQCDDIGTIKIPNMLKKFTNKDFNFSFCSGGDFPQKLDSYKLIIHCGGCMLNEREIQNRCMSAVEQNIPFTNYGITIAHINGILERSIKVYNIT